MSLVIGSPKLDDNYTRISNHLRNRWLLRLLKGPLINLAESLTDYLEGADKDERVAVGEILGLPPSKCFDESNNS